MHERRQAGRPSGLYTVGAQRAIATIATALPQVPMRSEHHFDSPRFPHPHVHVLLAAHDAEGHLLDHDQLQQLAVDAWIAHVDRMVDYARERPHLRFSWTRDGVTAGVDHVAMPTFSCTEFDELWQSPVVGHP